MSGYKLGHLIFFPFPYEFIGQFEWIDLIFSKRMGLRTENHRVKNGSIVSEKRHQSELKNTQTQSIILLLFVIYLFFVGQTYGRRGMRCRCAKHCGWVAAFGRYNWMHFYESFGFIFSACHSFFDKLTARQRQNGYPFCIYDLFDYFPFKFFGFLFLGSFVSVESRVGEQSGTILYPLATEH